MSVLEPPEGIAGDDERELLAQFIESMTDAATCLGMYAVRSSGQRVTLDEFSPPRVYVGMKFTLGQEAWSDRVQHPELYSDETMLEGIEAATWRQEAERIRHRYEVEGKLFDE